MTTAEARRQARLVELGRLSEGEAREELAELESRTTRYVEAVQSGLLTVDEVRKLERFPPLEEEAR